MLMSSVSSGGLQVIPLVVLAVWSFISGYLLFVLWWLQFSYGAGLTCIFILFFLLQALGHLGLAVCGFVTGSRWTILGSVRSVLMFLAYDFCLVCCWVFLMPGACSLGLYEGGSLGGLIAFFFGGISLVHYPVISGITLLGVLMESGRLPGDLSEAESELVSGFNVEFGGFLYALLASSEYADMLFGVLSLGWLLLGGIMIYLVGLLTEVTLVFLCFLVIRNVLPRFRLVDLVTFMWTCCLVLCLAAVGLGFSSSGILG
jgi:NADH-quinone oxidoreductase subunit H